MKQKCPSPHRHLLSSNPINLSTKTFASRTKSLSLKSVLYLIEKASRFRFVVVHTSIRRSVQNYYPSRRSLAKLTLGKILSKKPDL